MADLSIAMNEPQETVEELEAKIGAKRNGIRKMPDFIDTLKNSIHPQILRRWKRRIGLRRRRIRTRKENPEKHILSIRFVYL